MSSRVRFKFLPNLRPVGKWYEKYNSFPSWALGRVGGVNQRPDQIPADALRDGTYLIRFGKGEHMAYEYISKLKTFINKGRVRKLSLIYVHSIDIPSLSVEEVKALHLVKDKLTDKWQETLYMIDLMKEFKQEQLKNKLKKFKSKLK